MGDAHIRGDFSTADKRLHLKANINEAGVKIYSRKGDYARALRYYKEYNELGDSVASEKNIIHMQNMRSLSQN